MSPSNRLLVQVIAECGGFGKLVGVNKKGISVYKDVTPDGCTTVTSLKNGGFSKQISLFTVDEAISDVWVPHVQKGVHVLAHNYESGVTTEVKNLKVNYLVPFKEFNAKFKAGVRNEFSVNRFKQGRDAERISVGDEFVRISAPNFVREVRTKKQASGGSFSVAFSKDGIDTNYVLDQFITAKDYKLNDGNVLNGKTAIRKSHYEYNGKSIDSQENLMKKHSSSWGDV